MNSRVLLRFQANDDTFQVFIFAASNFTSFVALVLSALDCSKRTYNMWMALSNVGIFHCILFRLFF